VVPCLFRLFWHVQLRGGPRGRPYILPLVCECSRIPQEELASVTRPNLGKEEGNEGMDLNTPLSNYLHVKTLLARQLHRDDSKSRNKTLFLVVCLFFMTRRKTTDCKNTDS